MNKGANIYDVAAMAGVSHQTVSRVLNQSPRVANKTREKVQLAIAELGYERNNAARSLVTAQTRMIGVVITNMGLFGPGNTLRAMEEQASENGYFIVSVSVDAKSPTSIETGIRKMKNLGVEALVMIAPQVVSLKIARPLLGGIPIVLLDHSREQGLFSVTIDDFEGAKKATNHLIDCGHTKIGHLSGPHGWLESEVRAKGFLETCRISGLDSPIVFGGSWEPESGYNLAAEIAESGVTGVFCANDQSAIGLMRGLHELDVAVPGDISIIGYDDMPESRYLNPPLTTIRPDFQQLGKRLMRMLVEELNGEVSVRKELIEPELIIRESVKPLRK